MQHFKLPGIGWLFFLSVLIAATAPAQFSPIALAPESYTHDVVVEKTAPSPLLPVTTASMETGVTNTGLGWFERGYNKDYTSTGLPPAGAILQADSPGDHNFQMASSYQAANALLLDSQLASGTLTLTAPRTCAALSFLASSAVAPVPLGITLYYQNGSTQEGAFTVPSWDNGAGAGWTAYGKVDVRTFNFSGVTASVGRLFARDVIVSNTVSPVTRIEFRHVSGQGRAAIFAVSAADAVAGPFEPAAIQGYNQDVVVEASALRPGFALATTATLEAGSENRRYTLYEKGYVPAAPTSGLPAAGTVLVPIGFPGSSFELATNYSGNNAVVIDSTVTAATLSPSTPAAYSGLLFLAAASHGPVTNLCAIHHADNSWETNAWVADDYLTGSSPVFVAGGRVDISTRIVDCLGEGNVRLFAAPCGVSNGQSPITGLVLRFGGEPGSACTVLAVSGIRPGQARPVVSFQPQADGSFLLLTTVGGDVESAASPDAPEGSWRNEGPVGASLRISPSINEPCRFYRVRVK
jgi:hypothetical protein